MRDIYKLAVVAFFHPDNTVREQAANRILDEYETRKALSETDTHKINAYGNILATISSSTTSEQIRKRAILLLEETGIRTVEQSIQDGLYFPLIYLSRKKYMPENVRAAAKDGIDEAALAQIKEEKERMGLPIMIKYQPSIKEISDEVKEKAILTFIDKCVSQGITDYLVSYSNDERLSENVRRIAKLSIEDAAKAGIKQYKERPWVDRLIDIVECPGLSKETRKAAKAAIQPALRKEVKRPPLSQSHYKLLQCSTNPNIPKRVRDFALQHLKIGGAVNQMKRRKWYAALYRRCKRSKLSKNTKNLVLNILNAYAAIKIKKIFEEGFFENFLKVARLLPKREKAAILEAMERVALEVVQHFRRREDSSSLLEIKNQPFSDDVKSAAQEAVKSTALKETEKYLARLLGPFPQPLGEYDIPPDLYEASVNKAAMKVALDCYRSGKYDDLVKIAHDERFPESAREAARGYIVSASLRLMDPFVAEESHREISLALADDIIEGNRDPTILKPRKPAGKSDISRQRTLKLYHDYGYPPVIRDHIKETYRPDAIQFAEKFGFVDSEMRSKHSGFKPKEPSKGKTEKKLGRQTV